MNYHRDNQNHNNRSGERRGKKFVRRDFGAQTMHSAICSDCGADCQVPFKPSGDKPVYCRNCFDNKENTPTRESRNGNFGKQSFQGRNSRTSMHQAICDNCGNECEVPFRPSGEKPIYCNQCFGKNSGKHYASDNNNNLTKEQFNILNTKLDKILAALDVNQQRNL